MIIHELSVEFTEKNSYEEEIIDLLQSIDRINKLGICKLKAKLPRNMSVLHVDMYWLICEALTNKGIDVHQLFVNDDYIQIYITWDPKNISIGDTDESSSGHMGVFTSSLDYNEVTNLVEQMNVVNNKILPDSVTYSMPINVKLSQLDDLNMWAMRWGASLSMGGWYVHSPRKDNEVEIIVMWNKK